MSQTEKERAIQNLITKIVAKTDGITSEQVELVRELYANDERGIEKISEIEEELLAYSTSIAQVNAMMPMKKIGEPEIYALDIETPTKGIYLGETQIDLMTITEVNSTNELLDFIANCAQIKYSEPQLQELYKMKLDLAKRIVFDDYRNSLVGTIDLKRDPSINLRKKVSSLGLSDDIADEVIALYKVGKIEEATNHITTRLNMDFGTITAQTFKKHSIDYDDVKCSSYEEMAALAKKISDFDSITITSGKYSLVMSNGKFDPYHIKRELDFCKKHDVQARYHSLLTKEQVEYFKGKPKEEIKEKLRSYIAASIDFISSYNAENRLYDGMPVVRSVDIFNELINLKKDKNSAQGYYSIWEQLGLTTEDIVDVYAPAIGMKPEGVEYVYNEAFVETEEKRKIQLALAREIQSLAPELIDVFGTQMHITTDFKYSTIKSTFSDLKRFSDETGIKLAITEFDMYVPERIIDRLKKEGKSETDIAEYAANTKLTKLGLIAQAAKEEEIDFTEVAYWSTTDSMDHNKKRQGRTTLYGGLFGHTLEPKGVNEVVEYTPQLNRPNNTRDVDYRKTLNGMLESQPIITPEEHKTKKSEPAKQFIKKENETSQKKAPVDDSGFANFPQLLILTLLLIATLYILLM